MHVYCSVLQNWISRILRRIAVHHIFSTPYCHEGVLNLAHLLDGTWLGHSSAWQCHELQTKFHLEYYIYKSFLIPQSRKAWRTQKAYPTINRREAWKIRKFRQAYQRSPECNKVYTIQNVRHYVIPKKCHVLFDIKGPLHKTTVFNCQKMLWQTQSSSIDSVFMAYQ